MIKRILVGFGDVGVARAVAQQAIRFAQHYDAELTGITLLDVDRLHRTGSVPIGGGAAAAELRDHRLQATRDAIGHAVAEFEEVCQAAGVRFDVRCEQGEPFECMISCSRYYDLIVCGLKHLFEHGVVNEPPRELVRLVEGGVRPLVAIAEEQRDVKRVLVCYSGSIGSAKTMKRFAQLNLWPDALVRIVTFGQAHGDPRQLLSDASRYFVAHGYRPEMEEVDNPPKKHLLPYAADWKADAIVLGNSARNLLTRRIFGETALHVIQNTDRLLFLCQ